MSIVYTDTLKSLASTQDLTIGTTGQTVTLPGNDLRVCLLYTSDAADE